MYTYSLLCHIMHLQKYLNTIKFYFWKIYVYVYYFKCFLSPWMHLPPLLLLCFFSSFVHSASSFSVLLDQGCSLQPPPPLHIAFYFLITQNTKDKLYNPCVCPSSGSNMMSSSSILIAENCVISSFCTAAWYYTVYNMPHHHGSLVCCWTFRLFPNLNYELRPAMNSGVHPSIWINIFLSLD